MTPFFRRLHVLLTIGGGFLGIAITLQAFFAAKESNPLYYAILSAFAALYGYGIFAGFRLAEREERKHLLVFYCFQIPWLSSPLLAYRFASGFLLSGAIIDGRFNGGFRIGSDWQFSFLQSAPWGVGINFFALAMALMLLRKKKPNNAPEPTPLPVTIPAEPGIAPGSGVAHL